jgi:hypothetical protein
MRSLIITVSQVLSIVALMSVACVPPTHADTKYRGMTASSSIMQDFIDLRAFGANIAAFQVLNPDLGGDTTGVAYDAFIAERLTVLDQVITTAESIGMKILIVLFSPPGGMNFVAKPAVHRMFSNSVYQDQFVATWRTVALRYKGRTGVWGYDLLNEPAVGAIGQGLRGWDTLSLRALAAIREVDSDVRVTIEPPYGNAEFIGRLSRSTDPRLVYNVHSYFNSAFRSQGFNGRPINVVYPTINRRNPKRSFDRKGIERSLAKLNTFQRLRPGTSVIVGEFAAPRWAPRGSSARYLRDSIRIFERFGWDWVNHAWREADVWSPEHTNDPNNPNRSATETDRARVLKSFFRKNT